MGDAFWTVTNFYLKMSQSKQSVCWLLCGSIWWETERVRNHIFSTCIEKSDGTEYQILVYGFLGLRTFKVHV